MTTATQYRIKATVRSTGEVAWYRTVGKGPYNEWVKVEADGTQFCRREALRHRRAIAVNRPNWKVQIARVLADG